MAPFGLRLVVLLTVLFSVAMATVLDLKFHPNPELVIYEGAPAGTIVGTLSVRSWAAGGGLAGSHGEVKFSLHNSTSSDYADFIIDKKTGRLSTTRQVDRPVGSKYQIIARAEMLRLNTGDVGRFVINVIEPPHPSDESRLLMEPNQYEGEVEPESPVGMTVLKAMAFVNGSNIESPGNITYFIESLPEDDENSFTAINDWFRMDNQTGVVQLLQSPQPDTKARNVSFTIGAIEHDKSLQTRSPAIVVFHGLTRPRNLTVIKLSADAADVCWRFPLAAGARGFVLRYWRHSPISLDDESISETTFVQEMKIIDVNGTDSIVDGSQVATVNDEMRTVCSSLKHLESEAAYKLQVSACREAGAKCDQSVGPASAILHFTTQTNQCLLDGACETGECQISFEPPGFECLCHSGNYGPRCESYNPCVLSPCQNGATCRNYTNSTFDCLCPQGYDGGNCTVAVGPACLHQEPCLNNGTCSTDGCVCPSGYDGSQCQNYDPCWNNPCPNKANCTVLSDTSEYHCVCPIGFRGRDCDEAIDYCVLDPCQNDGNCTSKDGSYHCQCTPGYTGVACEQDVDECQVDPCENNSTCLNQVGSFTCLCPPGYTGSRCEEQEVPCRSSPCQNKGVCQNDFVANSYTCFCRPGFNGRDCANNIDDCDPNPCLNGASCRDLVDDFDCICPRGYSGPRCEDEDQCPDEVEESVDKGSFHWPVTDRGKTVTLTCPYGIISELSVNRTTSIPIEITDSDVPPVIQSMNNGDDNFAVRSCQKSVDGTVHWTQSNLNVCRDYKSAVAQEKSVKLETSTTAAKNLTSLQVDQVTSEAIHLVEDAIANPKIAHSFFNTLSNVMEVDEQVLGASTNSCERILDAIEHYTNNVPLELGTPVVMATPNIAIETVLVSDQVESYSFRPSFEGDSSGHSISMTVPKEAFGDNTNGVRLKFISYRSGKFFQSRGNKLPGQPGIVLAATVGQLSVSGLSEPVTYTMPLMNSSSFYSCVYWNELDKEWSTKGVKTRKTESGMIECLSDHLTAFSILLDPTPMDRISGYHEYILRLISYIGSGLSILGLSITVLLYSLFRNLRRDRGGKILLNLSISLLMLNIVFLIGSVIGYAFKNVDLEQRAKTSDRVWSAGTETTVNQAHVDICTALTISVHYLVLSSLSWMLVEAVHMYQLLILVFANSETCFMLKRMASAWGGPLIIVITTSVLCLEYYQDPTGQTCGRMSQAHLTVYYGAFIGPTCLILLINCVVFMMVLRVILLQGQRGRAVGKVASENGNGTSGGNRLMIMAQLRGAVTVMALLGVTWVAGALAIGPIKVFMSYVFCICNSLQGFVIFIVRVVQYPEARQSFITLWNTGQTHIPYDVTRHSSGPTTNSSGSAVQHSGTHQGLKARKTLSTTSKSPAGSAGRSTRAARGPDDSLTPSQAPTLPLGGPDSSSLSSYQHWFPSNTASPASNGSSQSRFRRIFGQLGLEPSSLRLSSKSNGKSGSHSLLERHVSGATNPPPSPGDKSHQILHEPSPLPQELIKPNFLIGEEISLLQSAITSADSSVKRSSVQSLPGGGGGGLSKEGANTSWTFLRPEDEIGDEMYQMGKGSTPVLKSSGSGYVERRRAASFLVTLPEHQRRIPRRSQSFSQEPPEVSFRDDLAVSLPRDRVLHS